MRAMHMKIGGTFLLAISLLLTLIAALPIKAAGGAASLSQEDWTQVVSGGFDDPNNVGVRSVEVFRGELYAGTANESGSGAQLWRMTRSGSWSEVVSDGFGDGDNVWISDLIGYEGQLYAGTRNTVGAGQVYRSNDGSNWSPVTLPGFVPTTNGQIDHFTVFNDEIYASRGSFPQDGAEIWRSATGDSGDWTQVASDGFDGDDSNRWIVTFEQYRGTLYAGTDNWNGTQVWASNDGSTWTQVNEDGFGDHFNWSVNLEAYQGYLYAATYNWAGSDNPGFELWRCRKCDGSDWYEVLGENKGLGDTANRSIRALVPATGSLYAVTYNRTTGIQVWRSADGLEWVQIITDGFGDANNLLLYWDTSVTVVRDKLHVGTWNESAGSEIWRQASS